MNTEFETTPNCVIPKDVSVTIDRDPQHGNFIATASHRPSGISATAKWANADTAQFIAITELHAKLYPTKEPAVRSNEHRPITPAEKQTAEVMNILGLDLTGGLAARNLTVWDHFFAQELRAVEALDPTGDYDRLLKWAVNRTHQLMAAREEAHR